MDRQASSEERPQDASRKDEGGHRSLRPSFETPTFGRLLRMRWSVRPQASRYTGLISTCFLRPSESLITPSGVRSFGVSVIFSSVTVASLTLSPPPLI